MLEFRSLELHLRGVKKRRNQIKIEDTEYKLSDLDTQKKWDTRRIKKCKIQRYWRFSLQNATNLWWH